MGSTQWPMQPFSQHGYLPLISLLLAKKTIHIITLSTLMRQEILCPEFKRLALEYSAWHSNQNNMDPWEPTSVWKQHFTLRQCLIYETGQEIFQGKICTYNPIWTDSIRCRRYCLFSKSLPVIVNQYVIHTLAFSLNV